MFFFSFFSKFTNVLFFRNRKQVCWLTGFMKMSKDRISINKHHLYISTYFYLIITCSRRVFLCLDSALGLLRGRPLLGFVQFGNKECSYKRLKPSHNQKYLSAICLKVSTLVSKQVFPLFGKVEEWSFLCGTRKGHH